MPFKCSNDQIEISMVYDNTIDLSQLTDLIKLEVVESIINKDYFIPLIDIDLKLSTQFINILVEGRPVKLTITDTRIKKSITYNTVIYDFDLASANNDVDVLYLSLRPFYTDSILKTSLKSYKNTASNIISNLCLLSGIQYDSKISYSDQSDQLWCQRGMANYDFIEELCNHIGSEDQATFHGFTFSKFKIRDTQSILNSQTIYNATTDTKTATDIIISKADLETSMNENLFFGYSVNLNLSDISEFKDFKEYNISSMNSKPLNSKLFLNKKLIDTNNPRLSLTKLNDLSSNFKQYDILKESTKLKNSEYSLYFNLESSDKALEFKSELLDTVKFTYSKLETDSDKYVSGLYFIAEKSTVINRNSGYQTYVLRNNSINT